MKCASLSAYIFFRCLYLLGLNMYLTFDEND
jgi:hypothetical protein